MKILQKARKIQDKYHSSDYRLNGELLSEHTEKVLGHLYNHELVDETLQSLTLLDHIEPTEEVSREILNELGPNIHEKWVTYNKLSSKKTTEIELTTQNRNKIVQTLMNIAKAPEVVILRLANKVENIKSTNVHDKDFARKVSLCALNIYAPLAKLTGFYNYAYVLENEGFKILNPGRFYLIENYIKENGALLLNTLEDISAFIEDLASENNINVIVQSRIKSPYSVHRKMLAKETENPDKLFDLLAVRCIVDTTHDCYKLESLLNSVFDRLDVEREDYIARPKPTGYMSLHNIYQVSSKLELEFQIRTHEMHRTNEFGIASHFLYKHEDFRNLAVKDHDLLRDLNYFEGNYVDMNKFSKIIYVFTPKNDIIELPLNSTVLDFAFRIHDDVGRHALLGFVNGKQQKLEYVLSNGDKVEIKKSNSKKSIDTTLLQKVKTKKAKSNIRNASL